MPAPAMDFPEEQKRPPASSPAKERGYFSEEESRALGERFVQGVPSAFEEVFLRFRSAVYVIGVLELGDPDEALDIVQETFRRAWTSSKSLVDASRLRSWLFAIARNLCVDFAKRARLKPSPMREALEGRLHSKEEAPLHRVLRMERAHRMHFLLQTVPEQFRLILSLRLFEQRSYQEIAAALGLPLHSVKNAVVRGGRILLEKIRSTPEFWSEGDQ